MKVAIIGSSGMLGNILKKYLNNSKKKYEIIKPKRFNIDEIDIFYKSLSNPDFIVNCAGAIPQRAPQNASQSILTHYYKINYLIPEFLVSENFKVIHACTDCVYSGNPELAPFSLSSSYDASDLYGSSKAKIYSQKNYLDKIDKIKVIRSSIIGEDKNNKSLYSWALSKVKSLDHINGYTDHFWNGITNLKWAQICLEILENFESFPPISVYGTDRLSKYELICFILESFNYDPSHFVRPVESGVCIDKTLDVGSNYLGSIVPQLDQLIAFNNQV